MIPFWVRRAAKMLRRKKRVKGSAARAFHRAGRNRPRGPTAVALWRSVYRFKETPAKKAGLKRALKRQGIPLYKRLFMS